MSQSRAPDRRAANEDTQITGCSQRLVFASLLLVLSGLIVPASSSHAQQAKSPPEQSHWLATNGGCLVWDEMRMPDETVTWSGACIDGKASGVGSGIFRYRENGIWKEQRYEGALQGGKLNGQATVSSDDTGRYSGRFADGKRDGQGVEIDAKGNRFEGEFRDGKKMHGIYTYANGTIYEGDFANEQFNGSGSVTFPDGSRYTGTFKDGLPDGPGTFTRLGQTATGTWSKGCLHKGGIVAAVGVPKETCRARSQADALIVPGERIGRLRLAGTLDDIAKLFGQGTDRGPSRWPGPGATLYTWDAAGVWAISDRATGNILWLSVQATPSTRWDTVETAEGIRLGIPEAQVTSALGEAERIIDDGRERSLYYDRRGIRITLADAGFQAGQVGAIRIVWPSVAHGDLSIVPGERISAISLGESLQKALAALGGGFLGSRTARGDRVYYWPHLGLSFVERGGLIISARSGANFPTDGADLEYKTPDDIGRGGTAAEITRAFGAPEQTRPERRFARATHWWIYASRGVAFALDDDQRIRIIDVFRPGEGASIQSET